MSMILFFAGTVCLGMTLMILFLYVLGSRVEGARSQGDGFVFFLIGLGPFTFGLVLYYLAWQLTVSLLASG